MYGLHGDLRSGIVMANWDHQSGPGRHRLSEVHGPEAENRGLTLGGGEAAVLCFPIRFPVAAPDLCSVRRCIDVRCAFAVVSW
jgi:hypothetical protein